VALFTLKVDVKTRNPQLLYELWSRLQDFSIVFANIIAEWARGNKRKFDAARTMELIGVDQPPVAWAPVTPGYYKQKHGANVAASRRTGKLLKRTMRAGGYPDWLMVRTGALRDALASEGGFAQFVDSHRAVFGQPLDEEAAAHARYNRATRPTIFLGRADRHMIRREAAALPELRRRVQG
jgi:hypothetical protein